MKRVTLADVAAHAGVSRSAASLAVRGTGRLSDETRERIKKSMTELGYVYHRGAATLRTQASAVIGLIITDLRNPFFAQMSLGVEQVLSEAGYVTVLSNSFDSTSRFEQLSRALIEHPVEALIYVPVAGMREALVVDGSTPVLAATRDPGPGAAFVGVDDHAGGYMAARHLIERHGRRRIAYLGGPEDAGPRSLRLDGVRHAVDETRDAELVVQVPGSTSVEAGIGILQRYFETGQDCDALICHSDLVAFAVCHGLRERGVHVPHDVSVIGFDGLDQGAVYDPPLTSITADPALVGRRCAEWVLGTLAGEERPARHLLETSLVQRASCGC